MIKVGPCFTIEEFVQQITQAVHTGVTGIGVVLVKGDDVTTHQFGLETEDLRIAGKLFREYASVVDTVH